ncbi:MAG TPA: cytochrome c [Bryobacteraceae bacterium]|nr:cytochrome c [Bryobacteraceae bacterium]
MPSNVMLRWFPAVVLANLTALAATPTFYKDVVPVLQRNCQSCHRPGEAAPMSFLDYASTRPWAKAIKSAVQIKKMPPWSADPAASHKFANDRSLSDADRSTLIAWVDAGAPEGNPADAPKPLAFVDGWNIGKPDMVFAMPSAFSVPGSGKIEYQYVVIPTNFKGDRWIQMAKIRPGDRSVVHHIIAFIRPKGSNWLADAKPGVPYVPSEQAGRLPADRAKLEADPRLSTGQIFQAEMLVGYAPGMPAQIFPANTAKLVPAGADLVFQLHYTASGKDSSDQSSVGLIFAKQPPERRELTLTAANVMFAIPPGDPNYKVEAQVTLRDDAELINLMPHMHLRGKDFFYKVVYPSGETETLLSVPKYDFNWQLVYVLDKPLPLPKGSRIECIAHFDNSINNRFNPDPSATVYFGDQTWEEMMIGFFDVTIPVSADPKNLFRVRQPTGD